MDAFTYLPPWSDTLIIGIAGSSGSGKTSLAHKILESLSTCSAEVLSMDSFYNALTPEQCLLAHHNRWDFDSPDSIDFGLLIHAMKEIKAGNRAHIPIYSFVEHQRLRETTLLYSARVVILEGILALHNPLILDLLDIKIYTDEDVDTCFARRLMRDCVERGRDVEGCIQQWFDFVKPNFARYVGPSAKNADIVVPRGIRNKVAIDVITTKILNVLQMRSTKHQEHLWSLDGGLPNDSSDAMLLPIVLDSCENASRCGQTQKDREWYPDEDAVYFEVVERLLIAALGKENLWHSAFQQPTVGLIILSRTLWNTDSIELFRRRVSEHANSATAKFNKATIVGSIQIRMSAENDEPELKSFHLSPETARFQRVMLVVDEIQSGFEAIMAIQVLNDHGIAERNITLLCGLMSTKSLKRVGRVWQKITVVLGGDLADSIGKSASVMSIKEVKKHHSMNKA